MRFRLADHVVVIECLATCPDEERGTHERRRADAKFGDLGDAVGEGRRVQENCSIKPVGREGLA